MPTCKYDPCHIKVWLMSQRSRCLLGPGLGCSGGFSFPSVGRTHGRPGRLLWSELSYLGRRNRGGPFDTCSLSRPSQLSAVQMFPVKSDGKSYKTLICSKRGMKRRFALRVPQTPRSPLVGLGPEPSCCRRDSTGDLRSFVCLFVCFDVETSAELHSADRCG